MDPFECNTLNDKASAEDDSIDESSAPLDLQRWRSFAAWQHQCYQQSDPALAERWLRDSNPLATSSPKKDRAKAVESRDLPGPVAAAPAPVATAAHQASPQPSKTRKVTKEMPVLLSGDTDLFKRPPALPVPGPSRRPPLAFAAPGRRSLAGKAASKRLGARKDRDSSDSESNQAHQKDQISSDEDDDDADFTAFKVKGRPPLKRQRKSQVSNATAATSAATTSTRSVKSTASKIRQGKPKLVKQIVVPQGRQMYAKFPLTAQYVDFLVQHRSAVFPNYRRATNESIISDLSMVNQDQPLAPNHPDVSGLFAGIKAILVLRTQSLMGLRGAHVHIPNFLERGGQVLGLACADEPPKPGLPLGEATHILVFGGESHSWSLRAVACTVASTERDLLIACPNVVTADWVGLSVRERSLAPVSLYEVASEERFKMAQETKAADDRPEHRSEKGKAPPDGQSADESSFVVSTFSAQSRSAPTTSAQERQSYTSTAAAEPSRGPAHPLPSRSHLPAGHPQAESRHPPADDLDSFMNVAKYLTDSEEEDVLSDQEKQQKHNLSPQKGPKRLDDDLTILSRNDQQYDSAEEGSDDQAAERVSISGKPKAKRKAGYQCEMLNDRGHLAGGPNADICEKLEDLRSYLETSGAPSAHWRQVGLQKALGVLRNSPTRIDTYDKAIAHKGIGGPTAEKIVEIVRTGELRRSTMMPLPEEKLAAPFRKIYGVGPAAAKSWIDQGVRSLDDLVEGNPFGIVLNHAQRLGLKHYVDLQTRIPRAEAEEIGKRITRAASAIDPLVEIHIMGSFRRGQPSCGDIDIIVTRDVSDGKTHAGFLERLCGALKHQGLLIDDLSAPTDWKALDAKYMGLCALDGGRVRHIDFLAVPEDERGAALIYFTGNDIFNRSLRLKARHLKLSLNQRGLFTGVTRDKKGVKLTEGKKIAGRTEEEVFAALGCSLVRSPCLWQTYTCSSCIDAGKLF